MRLPSEQRPRERTITANTAVTIHIRRAIESATASKPPTARRRRRGLHDTGQPAPRHRPERQYLLQQNLP